MNENGDHPRLKVRLFVAGFVALTLILFWRILIGEVPLPAGMAFFFPPWAGHRPAHLSSVQNTLLGDVTYQMYPWHAFVWERLRAFQLPLWNPYNGAGMPLLANGVAAPLAPLELVGALLPVDLGLSLIVPAKLVVAGAGMALFLRRLGCSRSAIWIGSVAFMFSGFMVVWLGWPQTQAGMVLPWLFWSADGAIVEGGTRWMVASALCNLCGLLGGHPETSAHEMYSTAFYAMWRLVQVRRSGEGDPFHRLLCYAGGTAIGIMLAGIQLIPLVEYLQRSAVLEMRSQSGPERPLPNWTLLTWVAPLLVGHPGRATYQSALGMNFNEQCGFVGISALALMGASTFSSRRRWIAGGFIVLALAAGSMAYGGPLRQLLLYLPALKLAANARFVFIIGFALATLAALGVTNIGESRRACLHAAAVAGGIAIFAALCGIIFHRNHGVWSSIADAPLRHLRYRVALFVPIVVLTVVSCVLLAAGHSDRLRRAVVLLFVLLVPVEMLVFAWHYNPTLRRDEIFPSLPETQFLREQAHAFSSSALGVRFIPNANILYKIRDLRSYDAVVASRWWQYFENIAPHKGTYGAYMLIEDPNIIPLAVAGARFLMTPSGWLPDFAPLYRGPLIPLHGFESTVEQRFTVGEEGASGVQIAFGTFGRTNRCHVAASVVDAEGVSHLDARVPCAALADNDWRTFILEPGLAPGSVATLRLSLPDGASGDKIVPYATAAESDASGCAIGGAVCANPGDSHALQIALRARGLETNSSALRRVWQDADTSIWEDPAARPAAYYADEILLASRDQVSARLTRDRSLRSNLATLVEEPVQAEPGREPVAPEFRRLAPERIEIMTDVQRPRLLVLNESNDPGWRATVDGSPTRLVVANLAYQALVVPPGRHRVELRYRPGSVLLGASISFLGLASCGALMVLSGVRRRRRRALPNPGTL